MRLFHFWKAAKEQKQQEKWIASIIDSPRFNDVRALTDRQRLVLSSWVCAGVCSPDGSFGTGKEVLTRKDIGFRCSWITKDGDCFSAWEVVKELVRMGILRHGASNTITLDNPLLAIECYDYPGNKGYVRRYPDISTFRYDAYSA